MICSECEREPREDEYGSGTIPKGWTGTYRRIGELLSAVCPECRQRLTGAYWRKRQGARVHD